MSLSRYIKSWGGYAIRHIPDIANSNVYDFSYCALSRNNRWNVQGEPTLYLAKDKSVAIGEFARHFFDNRSQALGKKIQRRQIWRFTVKLNRTLNLCDLEVCNALSLTDAPFNFFLKPKNLDIWELNRICTFIIAYSIVRSSSLRSETNI